MNTNPQKLSPADVHYLSFEGGGGKGAAYLGALAALAHPEIELLRRDETTDDYHLRRWTSADGVGVRGVAGASVGAITAALLASGWGVRALYADVVSNQAALGSFFDPADSTRHSVPVSETADGSLERLVEGLTRNPAVRQFFRDPTGHLRNLRTDYGLFAGDGGLSFLETSIRKGQFVAREDEPRAVRSDTDEPPITFDEHRERSGVELVLTGTNLRTGRAAYLSDSHGPEEMTVAEAVRISMGLPLVFKPVRLSRGSSRYDGLWVDGGVLNNNPIHAFDHADGAFNDAVLGLRLGIDADNEIANLRSYLAAIAKTYLEASERRELRTEREERQTVSLPIPAGTLGLVEFAPSDERLWMANVASARAVYDYFEVDGDPAASLTKVVGLRAP